MVERGEGRKVDGRKRREGRSEIMLMGGKNGGCWGFPELVDLVMPYSPIPQANTSVCCSALYSCCTQAMNERSRNKTSFVISVIAL